MNCLWGARILATLAYRVSKRVSDGEKRLRTCAGRARDQGHDINLYEPNAKAWLSPAIDTLSHEETTRIVVTMWEVWHARKKLIREGLHQPPLSTHHYVERFLMDLDQVEPALAAGMDGLTATIPR